jgi:hypothetical protein
MCRTGARSFSATFAGAFFEERSSDFFGKFATEVCFAILLPSPKKGAG